MDTESKSIENSEQLQNALSMSKSNSIPATDSLPTVILSEPNTVISTKDPAILKTLTESKTLKTLGTVNNSSGFFSGNTMMIIIIILFFALLGINIFRYLATSTDVLTKYLGDGIVGFLMNIGLITKKTTTKIVDNTNKGITTTSNTTSNLIKGSLNPPSLHNSINNSKPTNKAKPKPDSNNSPIQTNNNKSGWCYIGEDRGYRSCIKVDGENYNDCLSEQIYPTRDVCIHPNLRP